MGLCVGSMLGRRLVASGRTATRVCSGGRLGGEGCPGRAREHGRGGLPVDFGCGLSGAGCGRRPAAWRATGC